VGDSVYGRRKAGKSMKDDLFGSVPRQMLHAWQLQFTHPKTQKTLYFEAPIPSDMGDILEKL
jgi:23S rRNA-/tRNA-specific pseudouridylate synthase